MWELTDSITTDRSLENGLIFQTTLKAKRFIRTAMNITEMNFSAAAAGQS